MVSNSKDDHPSKATPVTNTGVTTHPQAITATRNLSNPSLQSHPPVWEKIKPANTGIQSNEIHSWILFMICYCKSIITITCVGENQISQWPIQSDEVHCGF